MKVVVYSTNPPCPKCKILKDKLRNSKIEFTTINNMEILARKGFTHVPMLEVNNEVMNFTQAMNWISERNINSDGE